MMISVTFALAVAMSPAPARRHDHASPRSGGMASGEVLGPQPKIYQWYLRV